MVFKKNITNRLSIRLIVLLVTLQAVMLVFLLVNNVYLPPSNDVGLLDDRMQAKSRLVVLAITPLVVQNDITPLADVFNRLHDTNEIVYAEVVDVDGMLIATFGDQPGQWKMDGSYAEALIDGIYDVETQIEFNRKVLGVLRVGFPLKDAAPLSVSSRVQESIFSIMAMLAALCVTAAFAYLFTGNLRKLEKSAKALSVGPLANQFEFSENKGLDELSSIFHFIAKDLVETKKALSKEHAALERESRFMQALLDGIDAVVMEARLPGYQFTFVSREAQNLIGYAVPDWLKPGFWSSHVMQDDLAWVEETIEGHTKKGESFTVDFRMIHRQGHIVWVRAINSVELDEDNNPIIRGLILDITDQKTTEDRIVYLAEHDPLTGLINRRRFQKELENSISFAERYQQQGALLFVDLDQFKYVNDTYGHQYGDEYLLDVSRRLSQVLRRTDILGRLGGDEFGIVIPKCTSAEAYTVGMAMLGALAKENLEHGGKIIPVSASIGIALFPTQSAVPSDLLAKADAAMYTAKRKGRGQVHAFSEDDSELWNMQAKIHWEERIRWALSEHRFVLYYQPVVELATGLITHYEVLLRMRGEDGEMISPGAFIETAERFGLIRDIDCWVVDHAIKTQADSIKAHKPVSLAINLSGRHFGNVVMLEFIQNAIRTYGADPQSLMFEVTETEAVENLSKAREFIDALRAIGCKFALDDFGIGFSSFHYLRNLPVDYIKIDGSFVRSLHVDSDDRLFVKAIVDLAKGLNIPCVAEFVENSHITELLIELGVDLGQGYHLAKPAPDFIDGLLIKI